MRERSPLTRVALPAFVAALLGTGCTSSDRGKLGPKWTWSGRLENAAGDVAVIEVEAYSYDVPKPAGAACLYLRAVHRPAVVDPEPRREVVLTVACEVGGVRRRDETTLGHDLVAPRGTMFNLFTLEPLPGRPTTCQFEFADRLDYPFDPPPDAPLDPIGVLCAEGRTIREGPCPGWETTPRPAADAGTTDAAAETVDVSPPATQDGGDAEADSRAVEAETAVAPVPLFGGRLWARLPAGRSGDLGPALPGKILTCTDYRTRLPAGEVILTGLELDALAGEDLEAGVRQELKLMYESARRPAIDWAVSPYPAVRPPLRAVQAVPTQETAYLCGPGATDEITRTQSRFFVALADGTVVVLDFSYVVEGDLSVDAVGAFAAEVMASLTPGAVTLEREAGIRVLPDVPPGEDLEFSAPADTVVSATWGTDSTTILVGTLRPLGVDVHPHLVLWAHSCEPPMRRTGRDPGRRDTLLGIPIASERGRNGGRFYEAFLLDVDDQCVDVSLSADTEAGVRALHAMLEAGRRVPFCTGDRDCPGRACVGRRCLEAATAAAPP